MKIIDQFTKAAVIATLIACSVKGCFDFNRGLSDYAVKHRPDASSQLTPR